MTKSLLLLVAIFISSFASAECGQGYVSEVRALDVYKQPLEGHSFQSRLQAIEALTQVALTSRCWEVQFAALNLLAVPLNSMLESVHSPAINSVEKIGVASESLRVKVKAVEVLRSSVRFPVLAVRKGAIETISKIASNSKNSELVSKATEVLREAQTSIFIDARNLADRAVIEIERSKKY